MELSEAFSIRLGSISKRAFCKYIYKGDLVLLTQDPWGPGVSRGGGDRFDTGAGQRFEGEYRSSPMSLVT